MKRIGKVLLVLALMLGMVACTGEPETKEEKTVIGIIQIDVHEALDAATRGFKDAVTAALGEDKVEFREVNAGGDSNVCNTAATQFVADGVSLIMANATPSVIAAASATDTIPVLGTSVTDYNSITPLNADGSTGINLSGTSDGVEPQMYVDCLLEVVPNAKKVSILYCAGEPNSKIQADGFIDAMSSTDSEVVCTVYTFVDSNDLQSVTTTAVQDCDALYIPTDNTAASNMGIVSGVTVPAGVPVICGEENMCKAGGLATISINYYNIGKMCGEMAVEVLNGKDVSTMPIVGDSNVTKKYNSVNADAINWVVPETYEAIAITAE